MAQKKVKMEQELSNGELIKTTSKGWNKESVSGVPVLLAGWQEGKSSHHPISLGIALAAKDKVEGAYLGDYEGVPVIDPLVLNHAMMEAFCDKHGIEAAKIRIAGNRSGAKKELNAIGAMAAQSPEVLEQLKAISPELYEKLSGLAESNKPVEEVAEPVEEVTPEE